ncbi:hypothetical protein E3U43_020341 [Larimichthys crocea]|uniref:Uncharacterized protein n=1 Tax=Larimichthys crocea TaxID=215358 RepID=A0ACD3QY08_LARCR|nr:hypothetical protein E3U43_020341 [Larimichthys crocea]
MPLGTPPSCPLLAPAHPAQPAQIRVVQGCRRLLTLRLQSTTVIFIQMLPGSPQNNELQHSESVSSFTLDLDLDLGPSMLGDVLGVMDGLGLDSNEEVVLSPKSGASSVAAKPGKGATEMSVDMQNELNGKNLVGLDGNQMEDGRIPDGNGIKPKGLRPKVRFSDKREEIIRQASEEEEGQGFDFQDEDQLACHSPTRGESIVSGGETEFTNHKVDLPPSPGLVT